MSLGRKKKSASSLSSEAVAVNAKNRCKSELYFLPRGDGNGSKSSKAAALLMGSPLPPESDLFLRLPRGTWHLKDLVGNDTAFVVKYDLRSVELPQSYLRGDDDAASVRSELQPRSNQGKITLSAISNNCNK